MTIRRELSVLAGFLLSSLAAAATFTVININDSGAGSLRQAILDANANPGPDTIDFAIPGSVSRRSRPPCRCLRSPIP